MIKKGQSANVLVRLPPEVKEWLVAEAARNCASHNSEVVRALREKMERIEAAKLVAKARVIAAAAAA
jgi:hypothetical protein